MSKPQAPPSKSNRLTVSIAFLIAEIILFALAVGATYLSEVNNWPAFWWLSVVASVIFIILKVTEAHPEIKLLVTRDKWIAQLADRLSEHGVAAYYNMQCSDEQNLRNDETRKAIEEATVLNLCANSGASYLDPSLYRH